MDTNELITLGKQLSKAYSDASCKAEPAIAFHKGELFGASMAVGYILGAINDAEWQRFLRNESAIKVS